jgi:hypothetical protein
MVALVATVAIPASVALAAWAARAPRVVPQGQQE